MSDVYSWGDSFMCVNFDSVGCMDNLENPFTLDYEFIDLNGDRWVIDGWWQARPGGGLAYYLKPKPKALSGFVSIYEEPDGRRVTGHIYNHQEEALINPILKRIACIDLSQFNEGDGL